ncbi:hypothetical protein [Membranihabitans marinus]|uniref:hypothetical protein n=1 Tax=Membranihabitans marinus TaxID=1227546 RepID=UPI001F22ED85|nr:hypothetical protein [Membranihabitans marinus]
MKVLFLNRKSLKGCYWFIFNIITLPLIILSCTDSNNISKSNNITRELSETEYFLIVNSNEYFDLWEHRQQFFKYLEKAQSIGYSLYDIRESIVERIGTKKENEIFELVFGSLEVGNEYILELNKKKNQLLKKFPSLNEIASNHNSSSENIENVNYFFDNYERIFNLWNSLNPNLIIQNIDNSRTYYEQDTIVCGNYGNQVKVLVCTYGCSVSTAGLGTAFCGWGCWCFFCEDNSQVSNAICYVF